MDILQVLLGKSTYFMLSTKRPVIIWFFITKVSVIIAEPNDDFYCGHFEYCYDFLAQKLTILEFFQYVVQKLTFVQKSL